MPNSDVIWINGSVLATLLEDVPCDIEFDDVGIASATLHYQCDWDRAPVLVGAVYVHPDFPWLVRKTARVSREEGYLARVQINFEGIPPQNGEATTEDRTVATYSLTGDLSTEPIETHPNFPEFAGSVDNPNTANGAKFVQTGEDRGRFLGFIPSSDHNKKAGVRSYLEPALTYSETKLYDNVTNNFAGVTMNKLGEIDDPPDSDVLPEVSEGRNWILASCTIETIGKGVRVTRTWRLSGRNGWDTDIYETA